MNDEVINPHDRMPVPNEYFYLAVYLDELTYVLMPAILTRHTAPESFYNYCFVFNKSGSIIYADEFSCKGWVKMFEIKTYQIIIK